jgi:hypothetical protein
VGSLNISTVFSLYKLSKLLFGLMMNHRTRATRRLHVCMCVCVECVLCGGSGTPQPMASMPSHKGTRGARWQAAAGTTLAPPASPQFIPLQRQYGRAAMRLSFHASRVIDCRLHFF